MEMLTNYKHVSGYAYLEVASSGRIYLKDKNNNEFFLKNCIFVDDDICLFDNYLDAVNFYKVSDDDKQNICYISMNKNCKTNKISMLTVSSCIELLCSDNNKYYIAIDNGKISLIANEIYYNSEMKGCYSSKLDISSFDAELLEVLKHLIPYIYKRTKDKSSSQSKLWVISTSNCDDNGFKDCYGSDLLLKELYNYLYMNKYR